ncbi:ABC transporter substrate-binding protein [Robertmurraya andreesenii]|uniref:Multiple sugar transport system substrate-binding protein n=1 Tax=Anoxybacillus andreesenii TaxID=1325932 RepID=A0ABT9V3L1_9BACL|nr:sugar ABC transporter substrate-binding protein [Robertmurraya andreesenii]MDQ0155524.1 multiple sugar transport system substrate-binding protein [Robertmurraya andreesenii]
MIKHVYAVVLLLFIFVTGCEKDEPVKKVEKESQNLTTLKVIADSEEALAAFRMEEDNIQKKFGIQLEYYFPNRMNDNVEDFLFASKETYDLYILFPGKIPQYVERDMLLPLDPYIQSDPSYEEIIPIYRNMYMHYNDHDYGVVYDGDAHFLFYRTDIFEKYSKEYEEQFGTPLLPPKTWEEYDKIAKFLTRDEDGDGKIDIYGTATFTGDAKRYIWFAERYLSMGGKYFDENMNPQIQSKLGVESLQSWIDLRNSGATPPNAMYDWIDLNNVFLQGKVAMVVQWGDTSRFSFDEGKWDSQIANKVDWTVVPGDDPNSPRGGVWIGRVLGISSETAKQEEAWKVIQYLTSKDVSSKLVTSLQTINDPYRESHLSLKGKGAFPNEEVQEKFLSVLEESLAHTNADLMLPGGWEYMQALDEKIGLALIGQLTAQEALDQTAIEWNRITESYGREQQKIYYQKWLAKLEEVSNR